MAAFDYAAAKAEGYSDDEINAYMRSKAASQPAAPNPAQYITPPAAPVVAPVTATPTPVVVAKPKTTSKPANPEQAVKKSLLEGNLSADKLFSGNDFVTGVLNTVAKPFVKTGQNIAGLGYEAGRALDVATLGDPTKKRTAKEQADFDAKVARATSKNPFINEADYSNGNAKGIVDQAKNSASIASYAVPFGKGANVVTKAILPGMTVGAAQELPEAKNAEDVAKAALVGGATAGLIHAGGKIVKGIGKLTGKTSTALDEGATALEQGTRKIRQKASIYGASNEKAINETLDKYGFKGSAQKQYANLLPTVDKIEGDIQTIAQANPGVTIIKDDIKKSFMDNLQSALRSKDLTQKQAITEIDGYIQDLAKAGNAQGNTLNLTDLRNLKKLVNADYGPVHDIMERGGALSPRQKVIAAAWDSLDGAVKGASPEMKALLKDESNLFKAAPSLSSARTNPPTFRLAGTSVTAGITQKGRDVLGGVMRKGSQLTGGALPAMASEPFVENVGARLPGIIKNTNTGQGEQSPEQQDLGLLLGQENGTPDQNVGQNGQNANGQNNGADSVNQPTNYITGYSPEDLYQAYLKASASGDKVNATALRQMYSDETSYQANQAKLNKGGSAKPLSAQQIKDVALAKSGLRNIDVMKSELGFDPIKKTYDQKKSLETVIPGSPGARKLAAAASEVVDAILRLRTGAQANPSEIKMYTDQILRPGDSYGAVAYKLQNYQNYLQDISTQQSEVPDVTVQPDYSAGSLPAMQ